jgi:hypothetical protein
LATAIVQKNACSFGASGPSLPQEPKMSERLGDLLERRPAVPVALLFLGAFIVRAATVSVEPLWTDEAITIEFARANWDGLLMRLLYDASGPGSYWLYKLWLTFCSAPYEVRYFSALAGAATVPVVYLLGRKLFDSRVGIYAALLLAINPYHFYYSQEIRYPVLLVLIVACQTLAFVQVVDKKSWAWAVVYAALTALGFWVQYFIGFFVLAQILWVLANRETRSALVGKGLAVGAGVALAVLPLLPILQMQLLAGKSDRQIQSIGQVILQAILFPILGGSEFHLPRLLILRNLSPIHDGIYYLMAAFALCVPLLIATVLGVIADGRKKQGRLLLASLTFIPLAIFLLLCSKMPMFRPKYLLPMLPGILILASAGVVYANRFWRTVLGIVVVGVSLAGLINQHLDPHCKKEAWGKVANTIAAFSKPKDLILLPNQYHSLGFEFSYTGSLPVLSYASDTPHVKTVVPLYFINRMKRLETTFDRIWIVWHKEDIFDPAQVMKQYSKDNWLLLRDFDASLVLRDIPVQLYAVNQKSLAPAFIPAKSVGIENPEKQEGAGCALP